MAIPAPALTDEDLELQVINELQWDPEVEASEVGVVVREGPVGRERGREPHHGAALTGRPNDARA
ncbi:MAG: hypothetical protein ABW022_16590 [Actinoplanes sp.]